MRTVMKCMFLCMLAMCMTWAARAGASPLMQDVFKVETGLDEKAGDERQADVSEETESVLRIPELEKVVDPDEYILGPYDYLIINVIGTESRSYYVAVLPEGTVFFPGVGAIHADGLTINEFKERLRDAFSRFFKNVEIFCYLKTPRKYRVFVTGEVNNAGPVDVYAVERLSDAIARAGDIMSHGSSRFVTITRGADTLTFDLLRFYVEGDFTNNPFLSSGDRIHVPVSKWHAVISNGVPKPGSYEIKPGETVADLILLAGGFTSSASRDSVLVTRWLGSEGYETMTVPAARFDMELRDLDEIGVFDRRAGNRRVFVLGAVRRTGRFYLGGDEGAAELLVRAGGFTEYADLDSVYVVRADGERLKLGLRELLDRRGAGNIRLRDGDVLEVLSIYQRVSVGGEVRLPGQFPFRSDWTVAQYVGMAGGPTDEGSIDRVEIISPDGSSRSGGKGDYPIPGDVIIVKRSRTRILAEFLSGVVRLGTVVVTIIVLTR
jgi:protein involved in polysaccharide export with SLBB domain